VARVWPRLFAVANVTVLPQ